MNRREALSLICKNFLFTDKTEYYYGRGEDIIAGNIHPKDGKNYFLYWRDGGEFVVFNQPIEDYFNSIGTGKSVVIGQMDDIKRHFYFPSRKPHTFTLEMVLRS